MNIHLWYKIDITKHRIKLLFKKLEGKDTRSISNYADKLEKLMRIRQH